MKTKQNHEKKAKTHYIQHNLKNFTNNGKAFLFYQRLSCPKFCVTEQNTHHHKLFCE